MKQLIVEIDDDTAADLERLAPTRSRQRSAFVRLAIRKALDAEVERRMEQAYREHPDSDEESYFDPAEWEPSALAEPSTPPKPRRGR